MLDAQNALQGIININRRATKSLKYSQSQRTNLSPPESRVQIETLLNPAVDMCTWECRAQSWLVIQVFVSRHLKDRSVWLAQVKQAITYRLFLEVIFLVVLGNLGQTITHICPHDCTHSQ